MGEKRPEIPSEIRREVRQRCGFGCVICGFPIYDYDHMIDYSIVKKHEANNLTLLCDGHHRQKTSKLITYEQVKRADANPFNIKNKKSSPYVLNYEGSDFSVVMGEVRQFIMNVNSNFDFLIPFIINDKVLIGFQIIEGQLFLNLLLLDENGKVLFQIFENEMIYNVDHWDVIFEARRLTIRKGLGKILFDIEFLVPNSVKIHRAEFNCDGYQIVIKNNSIITKGFNISLKNIGARLMFAIGKYSNKFPPLFRG